MTLKRKLRTVDDIIDIVRLVNSLKRLVEVV
jgi:hypothetical protein